MKIIKSFSKEGDLIYDPFSGTGTTSIAALKLKRKYIGSEIVSDYHNLSEKRILSEMNQFKMAI